MSVKRNNKIKLALTGLPSSPKLFTALQLAYGLCGSWERIIVIGSSQRDGQYQHIGGYNTLGIAKDATPQRYMELLNIAASCSKDVVILSSLSDEWQYGVSSHLQSSYYEEVLRSHRTLFHMMKHAPVHVIGLIDTRHTFLQRDAEGKRRLRTEQLIQQQDIGHHFTTVLHLEKRAIAVVHKDGTKVFPADEPFKLSVHYGALLSDWCRSGEPVIAREIQTRIDQCSSLSELYQLLFDMDIDNPDVIAAFTRRRLEIDETLKEPTLELIPGGALL
ncbi:MAG: hypothetical protein EON97_00405 [Chitinophagaceae bacterium]|nr:MAG: hypothetical protein EON97_00405 [Chitinophagaceae bacterium]